MDLSLDKNVFYNALLTTYHKQQQTAAAKRWLICVPHSVGPAIGGGGPGPLNVKIDSDMISLHILKPSPLLKCHYIPANPSNKQHKTISIELANNHLIVRRLQDEQEISKVRILSEELAYNSSNEQYKVLVIDRPLLEAHNTPTIATSSSSKSHSNSPQSNSQHSNSFSGQHLTSSSRRASNSLVVQTRRDHHSGSSPTSLPRNAAGNRLSVLSLDDVDWRNKNFTSCSDCEDFLRWLAPDVKRDVEAKILQFSSIFYFTAQHLEDDASKRILAIYDWAAQRFLDKLPYLESDHALFMRMKNSLESFINCLVYEKIFVTLKQESATQEAAFRSKLKECKRKRWISVTHFGAQPALSSFSSSPVIDERLVGLDALASPLEKMHALRKILDEINLQLDVLLQLSGGLRNLSLDNDSTTASPKRVQTSREAKSSGEFDIEQYGTSSSSMSSMEETRGTAPETTAKGSDALTETSEYGSSDSESPTLRRSTRGTVAPTATPVAADDLIAALIVVLISCEPPHLMTNLRYLELFTCFTADRDSLAYSQVTFQAATQYILSFKLPS